MVSGTSGEEGKRSVRMQTPERNGSVAATHNGFHQKSDGSMTFHVTDEFAARTVAFRCRAEKNTDTRYAASPSCLVIPPHFQVQISP